MLGTHERNTGPLLAIPRFRRDSLRGPSVDKRKRERRCRTPALTAEGLLWVYGRINGELHCTSLVIDRAAHISGTVAAERVVVDGKVEGPIQGGEIVLKSRTQVVGDIHHQSLAIESGAFFDGRSVHIRGNGQAAEKLEKKSVRQVQRRESLSHRIERVLPVEAE